MSEKHGCQARAMIVAVVGAESTGKTTLAHDLVHALTELGHDTVVVHETLRAFCEKQGRTPRQDEQSEIARQHTARIQGAASRHAVVIADTTALMTAVYSDFIFGDLNLYPQAMQDHALASVTLLTALDLPWVPDGHQSDGPHVQRPVDDRVRKALLSHGQTFTVVGGRDRARLDQSLAAVIHALGASKRALRGVDAPGAARWQWVCENCDAPDSHQGLFSGLAP